MPDGQHTSNAVPRAREALPPGQAGQSAHAPHNRRYGWVVALLVLLAAAATAGWLLTHRTPAVGYLTAPVTRGAVTRTVSATGTVNPELTVIVGTYVSGVIQQLFCDYNTQVKQGQICAKIDPRTYQATVDQDKASLAIAKAQLEKDNALLAYAEVTHQRNAGLAKRQYTSQDAADNARSAYEQAKAQVAVDQATIEQRTAQLQAAQVNLSYTDIASPVNGTVVSRSVTMGQTVAASFQTPTLFLIASDLTRMQVDTNVSESDIGKVHAGDAVSFSVDAYPNRVFQGNVTQVRHSPQTVQNVVTYDVVVGAANADLALLPGMTASVQVVTSRRDNVLRVPDQAFRYAPPSAQPAPAGETRIWLLRNGKPLPVTVTRGLDDDSNTEILQGGVQPGDRVITGEQRGTQPRTGTPRMPRL